MHVPEREYFYVDQSPLFLTQAELAAKAGVGLRFIRDLPQRGGLRAHGQRQEEQAGLR